MISEFKFEQDSSIQLSCEIASGTIYCRMLMGSRYQSLPLQFMYPGCLGILTLNFEVVCNSECSIITNCEKLCSEGLNMTCSCVFEKTRQMKITDCAMKNRLCPSDDYN